ncbi:putative ran-binding protein 1 [Cocos nucifera]|nr:putative ran-binding protein 1 [Cocos nucifera]
MFHTSFVSYCKKVMEMVEGIVEFLGRNGEREGEGARTSAEPVENLAVHEGTNEVMNGASAHAPIEIKADAPAADVRDETGA